METLTFTKERSNVKITIDDAFGDIAKVANVLEAVINNPHLLGEALVRAMTDVILPIVREAYISGLPKAVDMQWVKSDYNKLQKSAESPDVRQGYAVHSTPREFPTMEGEALRDISKRMRVAQMRNNPEAFKKAMDAFEAHRDKYLASLQRKKSGEIKQSHYLSSGQFRKRALQVMEVFTDPSLIQTSVFGNNVSAGIGSLPMLNRIETPSATEYALHKGHTSSPYNILWRHLEFGTGVYSRGAFAGGDKPASRYNEHLWGGLWYYGKTLKMAPLILHGSEGIQALYGPNGVASKSREFLAAVQHELNKVLLGQLPIV